MRRIGRRVLSLTAGCALLLGLGSAGNAQAATACQANASEPVRSGDVVTSVHTISCNNYVSSITLSASLFYPGRSVSDQRSCVNCAGISIRLSAPYVSGDWKATTIGFGNPWGDDREYTTAFVP